MILLSIIYENKSHLLEQQSLVWSKSMMGLTRGADAVGVQDVVPPDGFPGGSIQHGPHHLVKGLVGVTPQDTLSIFIDEAAAEPWKEKSVFNLTLLVYLNWMVIINILKHFL